MALKEWRSKHPSGEITVLGISEDSTVAETHAFFPRKIFGRFCCYSCNPSRNGLRNGLRVSGMTRTAFSAPMDSMRQDSMRQGRSQRHSLW